MANALNSGRRVILKYDSTHGSTSQIFGYADDLIYCTIITDFGQYYIECSYGSNVTTIPAYCVKRGIRKQWLEDSIEKSLDKTDHIQTNALGITSLIGSDGKEYAMPGSSTDTDAETGTLVSSNNLKTISYTSLTGTGNIDIFYPQSTITEQDEYQISPNTFYVFGSESSPISFSIRLGRPQSGVCNEYLF